MKNFIIMVLVCVNLALIAAVAFSAKPETAYAQVRRGGGEYMAVTARRRSNDDVLWVIEGKSHFMFAFWPDTSKGDLDLVALGPRDLERDFPVQGR